MDAYVGNSQQGKAVDYLNRLRDRLLAVAPTAATAGSSSGGTSSENTAATAAVMPSSSSGDDASAASSSSVQAGGGADATAGDTSTSDRVPVDPVGVQLLLGEYLGDVLCVTYCIAIRPAVHSMGHYSFCFPHLLQLTARMYVGGAAYFCR